MCHIHVILVTPKTTILVNSVAEYFNANFVKLSNRAAMAS